MSDKKEKLLISLNGGGPWGFRLQGGSGTGLPLVVSKVRRKSKAYKHLLEGDLILSVNDQSCKNLTYDQVMEIADKSGTDLTLEVLRQESSNKENIHPSYPQTVESSSLKTSSPLKYMENDSIRKEITSLKETSTKMTEEKEGLRIKSATLLPDVISFPSSQNSVQDSLFESFTSHKLKEDPPKNDIESSLKKDPFPPFTDLVPGSSTSSKTEEVLNDENTFRKITTETKHEVQGNTETSFLKKQEESVSKSILNSGGNAQESIMNDAKDLEDLINATQKKLESFKHGFRSPTPDTGLPSSIYEVKKVGETVSETKKTETFSSSNQMPIPDFDSIFKDVQVPLEQKEGPKKVAPPVPPKPKLRPQSDPLMKSFDDCLKEMERDLAALNGNLGFPANSTESSTTIEESPFGSTIITKKKKMFSSSSFYEEPQSIYPTVEEQVEMARKIADSLADDTNKKSKGSNMFYKRLKRSTKWVHEGPEPSDESGPGTPEIQGVEPPTPDITQVPFRPSKGPPNLKLVMDSRHPLDLHALRQSGLAISEHNTVSPEVCHGIVKDLQSPKGKGAALFAKRKKKSEEWVVDEEKVKALLRQNEQRSLFSPLPTTSYNQYSNYTRQDVKLIKSPWEAAMENPLGLVDAAFVHPDQLADTVIKAADKRRNSLTPRPPSGLEGCMSPPPLPPLTPAAAQYDIYHAKAPKGWAGSTSAGDYSIQYPVQSTPLVANPMQNTQTTLNNFPAPKKLNFQNFNTVPRLWRGTSAH